MTRPDKRPDFKKDFLVYPSKKTFILFVIGIVLVLFLAVYFFTRPAFLSAFDLSDKGPIGDAINGIIGPIIALISAGLLFYSFQAQLEANKRQLESNKMLKSQWEFDTYYRLYAEIEKTYEERFRTTVTTSRADGTKNIEEHVGWGYFEFFIAHMDHYLDDEESEQFMFGHLNTIEFLLEDLIILTNYVRESRVQQKHFFLHRLERFYHNRLEENLQNVYNKLPKHKRFAKSHDVYSVVLDTMKSLRENELKHDILGR